MIKASTPGLDEMAAKQAAGSIKASTPGLDAMAAKQAAGSIKASTPGLDAMAARQSSGISQNMTTQERAAENRARNAERKQTRTAAEEILGSGSINAKFREIVGQGGSSGRKLGRELARFERTGRVSSWLAGETVKAQAAQNAAQQAQFRADVESVVSYGPPVPLGTPGFLPPIGEKPFLPGNFSLPPPILGKTHVLAHDLEGKVYWMPAEPC